MSTLISLAAGALSGAVSGGLFGLLAPCIWRWRQHYHDRVAQHRGEPWVCRCAFRLYHRHGLVLGAILGALPPPVFDLPPLWAAFWPAYVALFLLLGELLQLGLVAIYARIVLLGPSRAQLDADLEKRAREALVGKEVAEAVRIAQQNGWHYEVVELQPLEGMEGIPDWTRMQPRPPWRSCMTIYVLVGKVISADGPRGWI